MQFSSLIFSISSSNACWASSLDGLSRPREYALMASQPVGFSIEYGVLVVSIFFQGQNDQPMLLASKYCIVAQ